MQTWHLFCKKGFYEKKTPFKKRVQEKIRKTPTIHTQKYQINQGIILQILKYDKLKASKIINKKDN